MKERKQIGDARRPSTDIGRRLFFFEREAPPLSPIASEAGSTVIGRTILALPDSGVRPRVVARPVRSGDRIIENHFWLSATGRCTFINESGAACEVDHRERR